jgi:Leucine-rich repeat (LRR) protein
MANNYQITVKYHNSDESFEYKHLNIKRYMNYANIVSLECSYNDLPNLMNGLDSLQDLEELYCVDTMLENIPASVGSLKKLKVLDLSLNPNLCGNVGKLPAFLKDLNNLETLNLNTTSIKVLPSYLPTMNKLKKLDLGYTQISNIIMLSNMESIETLNLQFSKVHMLPEDIGNMKNLMDLNLSETSISKIPESFGNLINLQTLDISATDIDTIAIDDVNLTMMNIESLGIGFKDSHFKFAKSLSTLIKLKVDIRNKEINDDVENLNFNSGFENLKSLEIIAESDMYELVQSVGKLKNIEELSLVGCVGNYNPHTIPEEIFSINTINSLKKLKIMHCDISEIPESICNMENLEELHLVGVNIETLPDYLTSANFTVKFGDDDDIDDEDVGDEDDMNDEED